MQAGARRPVNWHRNGATSYSSAPAGQIGVERSCMPPPSGAGRIRSRGARVSTAMVGQTIRRLLAALVAAAAWALSAPADAHDSWFAPLGADNALLALGTGNRFPAQEVAIDSRYLVRKGCRSADGAPLALTPLALSARALLLRPAAGAASCWTQLQPFDIELTNELVQIYLDESRPDAEVLARWAAIKARGLPWVERYTKHARIVLDQDAGATGAESSGADDAAGPALDLRLETSDAVDGGMPRAGAPLEFRLLDQGRPVAGQSLELRSAASPDGLWARTDADGRIRFTAPQPGRWLLRGIEIKPAPDRPDAWSSRFVTLAFTLRPALRTASL